MENITEQVKREIDELMCRKIVGLVEKGILKKGYIKRKFCSRRSSVFHKQHQIKCIW